MHVATLLSSVLLLTLATTRAFPITYENVFGDSRSLPSFLSCASPGPAADVPKCLAVSQAFPLFSCIACVSLTIPVSIFASHCRFVSVILCFAWIIFGILC